MASNFSFGSDRPFQGFFNKDQVAKICQHCQKECLKNFSKLAEFERNERRYKLTCSFAKLQMNADIQFVALQSYKILQTFV